MTTQTNSIIQPDSWHNYAYLWQEGLHKKQKHCPNAQEQPNIICWCNCQRKL